jgi:hypothetical protein
MAAQPLLRTLPGRAIVVGVAFKLLVSVVRIAGFSVPAFVAVIDTVAGVAIAAGAAYFLVQLFLLAQQRLLWRVRRKLILSYIFIGVVPAILIVAFFLLGSLLLFFNFSSYLVQAEVRTLNDRVRLAATSAALEIQRGGEREARDSLNRLQRSLQTEFPRASIAVVPANLACSSQLPTINSQVATRGTDLRLETSKLKVGPWTHVDPPISIPDWITCDGFAGVLASSPGASPGKTTEMFVRGVAFPASSMPGFAVVVDQPVDHQL